MGSIPTASILLPSCAPFRSLSSQGSMGARLFEVGAYLIPTLELFLMLKSILEDNKGCNVEIARPRAHVELQSSGEAPASILLLPFALLGYCFGLSLVGD